ncbi:MAG TPA: DUF6429 family protein [Novosphingobium sp.]|nr:DUF6429 family protein [Novosphingobium sp.]
MWLNEYATGVAWKGFDWRAMSRLHEKELISNPVRRTKSVYLTEEGTAKNHPTNAAQARI